MNSLKSIGLNDPINNYLKEQNISDHEIGRILRHDKTQYLIKTIDKEAPGELTGNLLHSDEEHPVVGDWVKVIDFDGLLIITQVLPRYSQLIRKSVGSHGQSQTIASNLDNAFIVQSLDHDFNLNRLERYIAMTYEGKITPVVILNKADLVSRQELKLMHESVRSRINKDIKIITVSALQDHRLAELLPLLRPGTTSCFLGSSGVGKSTIVNQLLKSAQQITGEISVSTHKGKHTTTSRQLFFLENGGMVIDTPGMRELGMAVTDAGLQSSFSSISELAKQCKFSDCTHQDEPGCAVLDALSKGELDADQLNNFHKLKSESQRFQKTKAEKNREGKRFGKMVKKAINFKNSGRS